MRAITPELEALLKAKFQAGGSGFRARVEIDRVLPAVPLVIEHSNPTTTDADATTHQLFGWTATAGSVLVFIGARRDGGAILPEAPWVKLPSSYEPSEPALGQDSLAVLAKVADGTEDHVRAYGAGGATIVYIFAFLGAEFDTLAISDLLDSSGSAMSTEPVENAVSDAVIVGAFAARQDIGGVAFFENPPDELDYATDGVYHPNFAITHRVVSSLGSYAPTVDIGFASTGWVSLAVAVSGVGSGGAGEVVTEAFRPSRISRDVSRRMAASSCSILFGNEAGALSRYPDQAFAIENNVVRVFQWYGDTDNEVRTFTGLIDKVDESRDPRRVEITCRGMVKRLIVDKFSTTAPQGVEEDGAVRTIDNGVYLNMEVSDIVADICDRAGVPTDAREITPTNYAIEEYVIPDGMSWAEAITGDDRLATLVGYELFDTGDGLIRFAPIGAASEVDSDTPQEPTYTFEAGVDLVSLRLAGDDLDLITRLRVVGPLTTAKPSWVETWHTNAIHNPVGLWYAPDDPANLRVIDATTAKLYTLRQSDRVVIASASISGVTKPVGLSGDPSDATIYWVLVAPWATGGATSGNSIKKVRRSDNVVLATYALANGRWTAIKASASFLWLTNWDTDKVHKHSKADGSSIASYTVTYAAVAQVNPTGLAIDGTSLFLFFDGTARFLIVDESDPTTVDTGALAGGVVSTAGTHMFGGEVDTTTHDDFYADSSTLGLVYKYALSEPVTNDVAVRAANQALEDELGHRSQAAERIHDLHPDDGAHPFEIRRGTLRLKVITSVAQATETAVRKLDELSRRRLVLDAGIPGNPGVEVRDMVRVVDPVSGLAVDWLLDTHREEMDAIAGSYVATVALMPWDPEF